MDSRLKSYPCFDVDCNEIFPTDIEQFNHFLTSHQVRGLSLPQQAKEDDKNTSFQKAIARQKKKKKAIQTYEGTCSSSVEEIMEWFADDTKKTSKKSKNKGAQKEQLLKDQDDDPAGGKSLSLISIYYMQEQLLKDQDDAPAGATDFPPAAIEENDEPSAIEESAIEESDETSKEEEALEFTVMDSFDEDGVRKPIDFKHIPDYFKLWCEARFCSRKTGRLGEHLAYVHFSAMFSDKTVTWQNETRESGFSYDITVQDGDGKNVTFIEVKSTRVGSTSFFLSAMERQRSTVERDSYIVAWVDMTRRQPYIITYRNPWESRSLEVRCYPK